MDAQPTRRKPGSARERQAARQRKRHAVPIQFPEQTTDPRPVRVPRSTSAPAGQPARRAAHSGSSSRLMSRLDSLWNTPGWQTFREQAQVYLKDARWYVTHHPILPRLAAGLAAAGLAVVVLLFVVSGRIFPGISALGVAMGGKTQESASSILDAVWRDSLEIDLVVNGEVVTTIKPAVLGLQLDSAETAARARAAGLTGLPFGTEISPAVTLDYLMAQTYLLDMTTTINQMPFNAGYALENGQIVGIVGRPGRSLDVTTTVNILNTDGAEIVRRGRLDLVVTTLRPEVSDPSPYLDQVRTFASQPIELKGYDPFVDQHFTWPIVPEVFITWLEAGVSSLSLRESAFLPYIEALNESLSTTGDTLRYLSPDETLDALATAITQQSTSVPLRVRYRPTTYEVQRGDTGYAISRRTGIPYYLIEQLNTGRNMDQLSVGDTIQIPSRDVTMQHTPLSNKRIIVNLSTQYLVAYEDGQRVFEWSISSGVANAPTSPGIFQILSHEEKAYGSSNTLCDAAGLVCGQWEMNWFMGIYEAVPGLINGFHGGVLLPNGAYLGGGNVGAPYTFGCVMSLDEQALQLYDWADIGTVVEIVAPEFPPVSDLAISTFSGA